MSGGPLGRLGVTLVGYVVVAVPVLLLSDWFGRVLVLPSVFDTLVRGGLVIALPVALLMAWHYPRLGSSTAGELTDGTHPEE